MNQLVVAMRIQNRENTESKDNSKRNAAEDPCPYFQ